ncbi:hypothetical protein HYFRA_00003953 [Hymenoscyphus fraxineus]|uniref:Uncharacterized protein n=1 Tax=Hymenoscyphus fraxineus TaxID=746836 RepID=A0A9N9KZ71_9HELO|nr:hypothetical protein HYFRA_00003953 [Hymenoscyphus fraxineus]
MADSRPKKRQKRRHTTVARMKTRETHSPSRTPSPHPIPPKPLPASRQFVLFQLAKVMKIKPKVYGDVSRFIIPWRKWVKGGVGNQQPLSKHTGKPLGEGETLEDIATEPFEPGHDFPNEIWDKICFYMDDATATLFSYTSRYGKAQLEKRKQDPNTPPTAFPLSMDHHCGDINGYGTTLKCLIQEFMGPDYIYDSTVKFYRTHLNFEIAQLDELAEAEESANEAVMEKERRDDAHEARWENLVERIQERNEKRQQRRDDVLEWLAQQRAALGEDEEFDTDDASVVSSDEELPLRKDFDADPDLVDREEEEEDEGYGW